MSVRACARVCVSRIVGVPELANNIKTKPSLSLVTKERKVVFSDFLVKEKLNQAVDTEKVI